MMLRYSCLLLLLFAAAISRAGEEVVLVVGDSLSAAYGIPLEAGWVNLLDQRIRTQGHKYRVVNASISGETSQGGRSRFAGLLERHSPALVIVELGANDGLRGYPPADLQRNLGEMADMAAAARTHFVLLGMRIPQNYGAAYSRMFEQVFTDLGARHDVTLVPFLLDGFAENLDYFQADQIHPTAAAQPFMLDAVWEAVGPLLGSESPAQPVTSSESG